MSQEEVAALIDRWSLIKEFKLRDNANVLVIGAYCGLAMEALDDLYHPQRIYGFEPQTWAFDLANERLRGRDNCVLYNFALGVRNEELIMGEWHTDACSFVNTGPEARLHSMGVLKETDDVLKRLINIHEFNTETRLFFDLVIINIESYEYVLLPYLRKTGWLDQFAQIAVQFHLGLGNDQNLNEVLADLDSTHQQVVNEFPAWILWRHDV